jgi:hypothetical protein
MDRLTMADQKRPRRNRRDKVEDPPLLPPEGFDPVNEPADAARLGEFWLPPRPDVRLEPELHAHWREMLAPPLRYVLAQSQLSPKRPMRKRSGSKTAMALHTTKLEGSTNWSGAYIVPNRGHRFAHIVGRWRVPKLEAGIRASDDVGLPFRCSIWIGLDGKKRWTSSMPQIGSEQTLSREGKQTQLLWWQWWQRDRADRLSLPSTIAGLPVSPGDLVLASLTALDPHCVRFHVANRTRDLFATVQVTRAAQLVGSSAEWVVERPADPDLGKPGPLYPLPAFGDIVIDRCAAAHEAKGVEPRASPAFLPRLIRMIQVFAAPSRTVVISAPSVRSERAATLRMAYRGK